MRKLTARKSLAAGLLSCIAVAAFAAAPAAAADLPDGYQQQGAVQACPAREVVILYDERGRPTVPARTPYYYCVTGTNLLPGDIPPPREYCCS